MVSMVTVFINLWKWQPHPYETLLSREFYFATWQLSWLIHGNAELPKSTAVPNWTPCPSTCGAGIQFRERFCNYPGTTNISRNCHGETVEHKVCHLTDCPVDGMWGHWGEWGECLAGRQIRSRQCDGPSPQHGGKECYTDDNTRDVETRTCYAITTPPPRVLEPPTIYGNASTMSGGNVSLLCLTTIAGVSVKWYYKENESLPLHVVQPEGTTDLLITGANIQNIGNYTCVITDNGLSSKAHQEVTMRESAAKIISLTSKPTHITDGATVQLTCEALGYPEPIIRWGYKDTFGNPYVPPPVKYTDGGKTILIASYQSILYGGTWTCNAVNKLGADHRDITI
ncbi:hypothetical protein ACJMK2_024480 [Sinanodonta woodiana]|uniref:Ig-like domain-containing protein n=1 Tax=Sinanodonta woodiana TaxID=1069815 RepID=A0ABD3XH86_SINWO